MKHNLLLLLVAVLLPFNAKTESNITVSDGACDNLTMVTKEEWRSSPRTFLSSDIPLFLPLSRVIIAHTAGDVNKCKNLVACIRTVQAIQDYHMYDRGWPNIAYNFMIGGDGRVYEGTGWQIAGCHTLNFNRVAIGIAFVGNYMEVAPTQNMLDAAKNLIACGKEKGYLSPVTEINGHRDVTCILSPGDVLYNIIKKWDGYKGGKMNGFQC